MKAIVFDNAGTLLSRKTILRNMANDEIFFETDTIGLANKNPNNVIVVFQTPADKLLKYENYSIKEYMSLFSDSFEIAYSQIDCNKDDIINKLSDDYLIRDIMVTYKKLLELKIQICSGCAMIINYSDMNIEYVYTAGGFLFEYTSEVINYLKNNNFEIYIASGDNKQSLTGIASLLNIPKNNIYDTCNVDCKRDVVKYLQEKGYYVYMVGNHTNDIKAITQADVGILTIQQKELLPKYLFNKSDYIIASIDMVIDVVKKECKL